MKHLKRTLIGVALLMWIDALKRERPEDLVLNIGVSSTSGTMRLYRVDPLSGRNSFSKATVEAFVKDCPQFKIWDSIEVETLSLNDHVSRYCNSYYPDLLSVDAEGFGQEISMAADFGKSRPKIICAEDWSQEMVTALQQRGFAFYARTWCCSIWLSAEILGSGTRLDELKRGQVATVAPPVTSPSAPTPATLDCPANALGSTRIK
jgi:hypothetical protein